MTSLSRPTSLIRSALSRQASTSLPPTQFYPFHPVPKPSSSALTHQHINFPNRLFPQPPPSEFPDLLGGNKRDEREAVMTALTGAKPSELHRFVVVSKRVSNMTKKGKMPSRFATVVVGSPELGLVGIGRGRGNTNIAAQDAGFREAVIQMDYVNRYENRTVWGAGSELKYKWGSTTVILRGRPAGFGLRVPPAIHRLLTACGIRDASATIEGSRNPSEVLKCAIQILHGGANPPGFGTGTGRGGRRSNKGEGMRSVQEVERERGRYGVDVGRRA
ncbi:hypothetical protein P7C73_g978, partial [Tremellales sp. Uapishka_1]